MTEGSYVLIPFTHGIDMVLGFRLPNYKHQISNHYSLSSNVYQVRKIDITSWKMSFFLHGGILVLGWEGNSCIATVWINHGASTFRGPDAAGVLHDNPSHCNEFRSA